MSNIIFLDHNSTTPVHSIVYEAMIPYFSRDFFNPGGLQYPCERINDTIEKARSIIADRIHGTDGILIFTASASEANNIIIQQKRYDCVITSPIEHPSVLVTAQNCKNTQLVNINEFGQVDIDHLESILKAEKQKKILVSIQYANQVIHTIQPVKEISKLCKKYGVDYHVDATQAFGKISVNVNESGIDFLTLSAHKCYGPKGIGAIWMKKEKVGSTFRPLCYGGHQELGLRAGTNNVPGIVGFSKACEISMENLKSNTTKLIHLQKKLLTLAFKEIPDIKLNGHPEIRVPGGVHLSINKVDIRSIVKSIPNIIVSTGMACSTTDIDPIFSALKRTEESRYSLRLQLGFENTDEEVEYFIQTFSEKINKARQFWGEL